MKILGGQIYTPNGKNLLTAVNGGGLGGPDNGPGLVALHTDQTSPGPWEAFKLILQAGSSPIGPGMKFALQTANGVNYVTAINGGGIPGPNDATCPIHTDAVEARQWEKFTLQIDETVTPPTVRLLTSAGNYVTAVNGGGVGGPNTQPVHTDAKAVGNWEQFSLPPSMQLQPVQSQAYTFSLDKFVCNKMRSNNFLGTERDTGWASLSIIVNNGAPQTQTQSMGSVDAGHSYPTNLRFPSIQVADTDNVIIQYHVINASGGQAAAVSTLEQAAEKIGSAAAQALATAGGTALGAAIGAALGTAAIPLIGSALGALAGWVLGTIWGQLNANCDGPVAAAVHVYSGAALRILTANGPLTLSEDNPGGQEPDGCGNDPSDYVVEWSVSVG